MKNLTVELLGHPPRVSKTDPEANKIFLQANHLFATSNSEYLQQALALYQEEISIDSGVKNAF